MDAEQVAYRERSRARAAYQAFLDERVKGSPVARAALELRYRPIAQYQKEGPHVGQEREAESDLGRIN